MAGLGGVFNTTNITTTATTWYNWTDALATIQTATTTNVFNCWFITGTTTATVGGQAMGQAMGMGQALGGFGQAPWSEATWDQWVAAEDIAAADREAARNDRQRQREEHNQRERERRQAAEMAAAERAAAKERARLLLIQHLTEAQIREFTEHGWFEIEAPSGRRYRLLQGSHGNVRVIDRGAEIERLCIAPAAYDLPFEDVMLAQKLAIETDEPSFRRIANITTLRAA